MLFTQKLMILELLKFNLVQIENLIILTIYVTTFN